MESRILYNRGSTSKLPSLVFMDSIQHLDVKGRSLVASPTAAARFLDGLQPRVGMMLLCLLNVQRMPQPIFALACTLPQQASWRKNGRKIKNSARKMRKPRRATQPRLALYRSGALLCKKSTKAHASLMFGGWYSVQTTFMCKARGPTYFRAHRKESSGSAACTLGTRGVGA